MALAQIQMKILLILFVIVQSAYSLTLEEMKSIAKKEHSRHNISKELLIFPDVREYKCQTSFSYPEGIKDPPPVTVSEKIVDGKYVVIECNSARNSFLMVVTFDIKLRCYKQWFYIPAVSQIHEYMGNKVDNTISWYRVDENEPKEAITMKTDVFYKDKVVWSESHYKNKKIQIIVKGVNSKTN